MKTIITASILCLFLFYTGKSQNITTENNKLCFDSASVVELYKTIIYLESLRQEVDIYQEAFANYDSAISGKDKLLELQTIRVYTALKEVKEVEKELLAEKNRHQETIADNKKQKRRLIFSFSSITIIAVLTSILVSR